MALVAFPRQFLVDANGAPRVGAKAHVYQAGTSTPVTTYKTPAYDTPHTNPVLSVAGGLFPAIYVNPDEHTSYKLVVTDKNDVELYSDDNISALGPPAKPRYNVTPAEQAAGVVPSDFAASSRPWTDAALRYGLNGDGVTDNTAAFARMCSVTGQALLIRRGDYVTGKFALPANTTLYLEPGTIIRDSGVLGTFERLINITNTNNVHIIGWGAKVLMDRAHYTTGEQRHGVFIAGTSRNICVEGLESNGTGGDGYYIGSFGAEHGPPTNIRLVSVSADNSRRQGLSITAGRHIRVLDSRFTNTKGTNPEAGVDIEPNSATAVLSDIRIVSPYTAGNAGAGIKCYLENQGATSEPCSIDIVNHVDVGSVQGGVMQGIRAGSAGRVRWHSPVWMRNNHMGFGSTDNEAGGILTEVFDPCVIDCNQEPSAAENAGSAFYISREAGNPGVGAIGGIHIYRPSIEKRLTASPVVAFYCADQVTANAVEDIRIIDPQQVVYSANATRFSGKVFVRDSLNRLRRDLAASRAVASLRYFSLETNAGAVGSINLDLEDWPQTDTERAFEVVVAQNLTIRANQINAANRIFPGSYTTLQSNEVGARLTLRKTTGGYQITSMVGVWRAPSTAFTTTNAVADYSFDPTTATTTELGHVLATLIKDLRRGT